MASAPSAPAAAHAWAARQLRRLQLQLPRAPVVGSHRGAPALAAATAAALAATLWRPPQEARCLSWPLGSWDRRGRSALSWRHIRTARARALCSDQELQRIASMINLLVDLPSWTERQEQELFEHATAQCIEAVAGELPPPFFDLLRSSQAFIDEEALCELKKKLVGACREQCRLPYLDEQDKRRIARAVIWVLIDAMMQGRTLDAFTRNLATDEAAHEIVVNVFMEGAMDVFFDEDMRKAMVQDMTCWVKEVPFVPNAALEYIVERVLLHFSGILQKSLREAYTEYVQAVAESRSLAVLPDALEGSIRERDRALRIYEEQPFLLQLRRIFVRRLLEEGRPHFLPQGIKARILVRLVDATFAVMPGIEKLEHTVQPFHAASVVRGGEPAAVVAE